MQPTIWIDNDACPKVIREIVFKAGKRLGWPIKMVANSYFHPPQGFDVEMICVNGDFDAADDHIAEQVQCGDLVITGDVPLADRVVSKKATALSPRGLIFDADSIKERLAMRNLSQELRSGGDILGGPAPFGPNDAKKFAGAFDRLLGLMQKQIKDR